MAAFRESRERTARGREASKKQRQQRGMKVKKGRDVGDKGCGKGQERGTKIRERWVVEKRKWDGARQERAAELWLLCSMLLHMAPLPNSLKRPELRFGLPAKRWISAFLWASLLPPLTRLHTCSFWQLSLHILVFEVWAYVTLHAV